MPTRCTSCGRASSPTLSIPPIPARISPDGAGLSSHDGVAITGSGLHIYRGGPAITPQIELVREAPQLRSRDLRQLLGLQVLTVAGGGVVRRNPRGRELGIGRNICLTDAASSSDVCRQAAGMRSARRWFISMKSRPWRMAWMLLLASNSLRGRLQAFGIARALGAVARASRSIIRNTLAA